MTTKEVKKLTIDEDLKKASEIQAMVMALNVQLKEKKAIINSFLKENNVSTYCNGSNSVTLSIYDRKVVDTHKLQANMPEVYEKFLKISLVEKLTIK